VVIVDETGVIAQPLRERLERSRGTRFHVAVESAEKAWAPRPDGGGTRIEEVKRAAGEGRYLAIVVTESVLEKREPKEGEHAGGLYCASGAGALKAARLLQAIVNDLVNERVLAARQIPKEVAALVMRPAIEVRAVSKEGKRTGMGATLMPLLSMLLLYMGIVGISQMLISSTLEEKANRIYEVLLSSVSPFQLMAGKILGICGVGLTLLTLWSGGGLIAAALQGAGGLVTGAQIGWFLVYYLLGFLMIASLMVAIGSACNTVKEAQNLMAPLSVLLALPMILGIVTLENPNGSFATLISFIPPFTPFMMMARMASVPSPPDWQLAVTLGLLILATYLSIRLAARIFRVGVLLYGQPPSFGQILRWLRERD
jgi:ABC-2 type transport system permease protein